MRIGELMVRQGVLTPEQVDRVLEEQAIRAQPFGLICEQIYGIAPEIVEACWVEQYTELTGDLVPDFDTVDPSVRDVVTRRQAWQFRIVPVRWDDGALVLATTRDHLQKALRFATNGIPFPVYFVVADADTLTQGLEKHYPMGGLGRRVVEGELEQIATNLASRRGSAA